MMNNDEQTRELETRSEDERENAQVVAIATYQRRIAFEEIINALIAICCLAYIIALMTLCGIV
jgi:hypothetical protein